MSVLVVGSFVTDLVATTKRAPQGGETVIGTSFNTSYGGKGANQAIAVKRFNGKVSMAGALGKDNYGNEFLNLFKKEGIDTKLVKQVDYSTGCSVIVIDEKGQNRIVMTPGANLKFDENDLKVVSEYINENKPNYVIAQFEMSDTVVKSLAKMCNESKTKLVVNPAPAKEIEDEVLEKLYLLIPNETELGIIVKKELTTDAQYIEAAKELTNKGVENVIVTLGDRGSLLVNKNEIYFQSAYKVKAIDTVGAGDTFIGTLVSALDQGYTIKEAMKFGSGASAIEVTKRGAIAAIPLANDVFEFLKNK